MAVTSAPSRTATSSRQIESAPPESITSSGSPGRMSPEPCAAASASAVIDLRSAQHLRLVEPLQLHVADVLEAQVVGGLDRLEHRVGHDHLAAARPRDDPRGQVHLAP